MTLEKQPPGVWFLTCDSCGEQIELDTDPDEPITEAVDELKELGWRANPPEQTRFTEGPGFRKNLSITYWTHDCPDCRN